jgi:putative protease
MSAKDMCLINHLEEINNAGVHAIKIEGRMKSEHYIATVVNAYRKLLDDKTRTQYINDIATAANRDVSVG